MEAAWLLSRLKLCITNGLCHSDAVTIMPGLRAITSTARTSLLNSSSYHITSLLKNSDAPKFFRLKAKFLPKDLSNLTSCALHLHLQSLSAGLFYQMAFS